MATNSKKPLTTALDKLSMKSALADLKKPAKIGHATIERMTGPQPAKKAQFRKGYAKVEARWIGSVRISVQRVGAQVFQVGQARLYSTGKSQERLYIQPGLDKLIGAATTFETSRMPYPGVPIKFVATIGSKKGVKGQALRGREMVCSTLKEWGVSSERMSFLGKTLYLTNGEDNPIAVAVLLAFAKSKVKAKLLDPNRRAGALTKGQRIQSSMNDLEESDQERLRMEVTRWVRNIKLRKNVGDSWGMACAACGKSLRGRGGKSSYECEIAHVQAVKDRGTDKVSNAMPLCRAHHWAFDARLWAINLKTRAIHVARGFENKHFLKELVGRKLAEAKKHAPKPLPGIKELRHQWKQFKKAEAK